MNVGIILPTYNQAKFLYAALDALQDQSLPYKELVIVDDGSNDDTGQMLANLPRENGRIRVLHHRQNEGTAAAINDGFALMGEKIHAVTWVSSDNVMTEDWLEVLVEALTRSPTTAAVYSGFSYERPGQPPQYLFKHYDPKALESNVNCYIGPSFLIRRGIWREAGGHRGAITHDYDHWLRIEEVAWRRYQQIIGVDKSLCHYNAHHERATIVRAHEFDAHRWQKEAIERRARNAAR